MINCNGGYHTLNCTTVSAWVLWVQVQHANVSNV